ncbi:hypothetical protein Tco_1445236, partial [Tanacetum coccineum]
MAPLPPCEQRHLFLRYLGLKYTDADISDIEERLERIYSREIHRVQVVDFQGTPELIRDGLFARMVMEHRDDAGVVVFTSQAWGGCLILGYNWFGSSFWSSLARLDLEREEMESFGFARGLDVGSVNIPYLLARYLRRFAAGRKSMAYISGGQFVARLAEHFGPLAAEILGGLIVIAPELLIIDMERQPDAAAGAHEVAQDDEGGHADLAPAQAAPPQPAISRNMLQRMARLKEDVHEIRGTIAEQ